MRIVSGTTDHYVYFVAVDSTDFTTRETGLSSFTVYRSRNGGAATAMTTPTINEVDSTNMPGVYELLLDEDTTLDADDDTQEMAFHITHSGMAPVTRVIELYRPEVTAGQTIDYTGGLFGNNTISASTLAATVGEEIADAVKSRQLTDAFNTDGTMPTLEQAVYQILQRLTETVGAGTTLTTYAVDGSTSRGTYTIDDATNPTSITRAS